MRTLSAGITTQLAATTVHVVPGLRVHFGGGNWRFWSAHGEFNFEGSDYIPRIVCDESIPRISNWKRRAGPSDDVITVSIGNADLYCTDLYQQFAWKEAKVELIRFFPDIGEGYVEFTGYGKEPAQSPESFEWEILFGQQSLRRRMLREFSALCSNVFAQADGDCPYNPALGYGVYQSGSIPYTSCNKSKSDCIQREMFGANPYAAGGSIARRFFTGLLMPPQRQISGRAPEKRSFGRAGKAFSRDVLGNETLMGNVIPACFGNTRIQDMPKLAASFDAGRFVWALCIASEGRCNYVHPWDVSGDDLPPDNPAQSGDVAADESLMIWGVNNNIASGGPFLGGDVLGIGDASLTDSEDPVTATKKAQIAAAIGQRRSLASQRGSFLDTYLGNPRIYNMDDGDGLSLSGLCALLIRIDYDGTGKSKTNDPKIAASIQGILCRRPQSDSSVVWTATPNPIDVWFHMQINRRYGAGEAEAVIDVVAAATESDYCDVQVTSTQSLQVPRTGTVTKGPGDWNITLTAYQRSFIFVAAITTDVNLNGVTITVTTAGGAVARTVARSWLDYNDQFDENGDPIPSDLWSVTGLYIEVSEPFPSDKLPDAGDTFVISGSYGDKVPRFKFDGFLSESKPAGELSEEILANCNGTFIQTDGLIRPVIRKAVDLAAIDALALLTDKGTSPNILWRNGMSSVRVKPAKDIPNAINVKFLDREENYGEQQYEFYDEQAQIRASRELGEVGKRIKLPESLNLNGTASKDQAARLAVLKLREVAYPIEFEMSLKDAEVLNPVEDVRRIQSDYIISTIQYIRIMEIEKTSDFTAKILAHAHWNEMYDDSAGDFNKLLRPDDSDTDSDKYPIDVTPLLPVEISTEYSGDGIVKSGVTLSFTWNSP